MRHLNKSHYFLSYKVRFDYFGGHGLKIPKTNLLTRPLAFRSKGVALPPLQSKADHDARFQVTGGAWPLQSVASMHVLPLKEACLGNHLETHRRD